MNEIAKIAPDAAGSDAWEYDLGGRIRNLGLPATSLNALFPLFEAISNALHAIETRFDREAPKAGRIKITVLRQESDQDDAPIEAFHVSDNGVGLGADNWRSFRTADTPAKIKRGGKGVGRLSWLKVFKSVAVRSFFLDNDKRYLRTFNFSLSDPCRPISAHDLIEVATRGRQERS